jgi:hypothetical protein
MFVGVITVPLLVAHSLQIRAQEPDFHCWKAALACSNAEEVMNSGSGILRAHNDMSGYRWGVERKRRLLEREVVA